MSSGRARIAAILCFAAAAVLVGLGNQTGHRIFTAVGFVCFAVGALAFLRWRRAQRAKVFDREDKTFEYEEKAPPEGE